MNTEIKNILLKLVEETITKKDSKEENEFILSYLLTCSDELLPYLKRYGIRHFKRRRIFKDVQKIKENLKMK